MDPLPNDAALDYVPTYITGVQVQHKQYYRDADALFALDSNMPNGANVVAIADNFSLSPYPSFIGSYNLAVLKFDALTGVYVPSEFEGFELHANPIGCPGFGITEGANTLQPGVRGCALRPDGHGVFVTGEKTTDCATWQPFVEHIELETGISTDLTSVLPSALYPEATRCRIYRNTSANGLGASVYIPKLNGVVALDGVETPSGVSYEATPLGAVSPAQLDPGSFTTAPTYARPRFLDIGVAGDPYLQAANRALCCNFLSTHGNGVVEGHTAQGITTWTPGVNPYGYQRSAGVQ
ncbi:MAG: hypothetical protein IPL52_11280 [Flavobacteriales bacterium]|nr:hypothetical protein [Flavobacteriales bacterium]